ncbi:MAG TPA: cytochrome c biogenesis protein DipZ, partial [Ramlibacter sp.]|nr:cytochrome c biogenesis protein DipZ [Ramlibacter sp.]
SGQWKVGAEAAELQQPGGRIVYRFRARDLHLVLGPGMEGQPVRFRIRVDGQPPGKDRGSDVDANGLGTIDGHRLYQLVRQANPGRERLFEIEFLDGGASAYAFTFG